MPRQPREHATTVRVPAIKPPRPVLLLLPIRHLHLWHPSRDLPASSCVQASLRAGQAHIQLPATDVRASPTIGGSPQAKGAAGPPWGYMSNMSSCRMMWPAFGVAHTTYTHGHIHTPPHASAAAATGSHHRGDINQGRFAAKCAGPGRYVHLQCASPRRPIGSHQDVWEFWAGEVGCSKKRRPSCPIVLARRPHTQPISRLPHTHGVCSSRDRHSHTSAAGKRDPLLPQPDYLLGTTAKLCMDSMDNLPAVDPTS